VRIVLAHTIDGEVCSYQAFDPMRVFANTVGGKCAVVRLHGRWNLRISVWVLLQMI